MNLFKFNKSDVLNDFQTDLIDNFISDLYDEGIIIKSRDRYHYLPNINPSTDRKEFEFNNILFFTYFLIISKIENI